MKKINVKNILIIMLILVEVIATYFMYKSGTNKEVVLDNVELKELTDNNSFAIYLDGNEYKGSSTWPESAAFQKAECQNEKGDILNGILTFNEEENKAYISNTTQTTYCYLYFKSCNGPVGTVLADKPQVTECEVGGMYRYQGTNDVNNWICFGTTKNCSSNDTDIDKYMYRIIGVTPEGELKLIKETFVEENDNVSFYWNNFKYTTDDCGTNGEKCMWPDSIIFKRLNGTSNGSKTGYNGDTNIFIGNSYYEYLNNGSVWLNKIENHNWKYGVLDSIKYNGDEMYAIENEFTTNNTVLGTSSQAKIGLMYIHDYLYAYPDGNPGNSTNAANSWIHYLKDGYNGEYCIEQPEHCNSPIPRFDYENTMTNAKFAKHPWYYNYLSYSGSIYADATDGNYTTHYGNRPVFYLTPDVTFKTGTTGEKSNPYIIDGIEEETYTATFHYGSKKNDTITTPGTAWYASWTLPDATEYCLTRESTSANCLWTSFPPSVTNSYSYGNSFPENGTYTYYFYVRNAAGQIASDSDTVTVSVILPTCSLTVTTSGISLVKSDDATSWYLSTSPTSSPSYGTGSTTSALGEHTYYGYVKNNYGTTGTCQLEMYKATQNACYQTGSSDGGYTNCTGTYMLGAYTPTEDTTTGKCFLSHESSNRYNNCSAPCDVIRSGLGTIPSSVPTCPNGYYSLDSCTCSCQSVTTYTCSNGQTCGESGCCSRMFCGSDNCRSGYTAIEYDTYTRYCYK